MRYEGDIYRPPGEGRSFLLQATVGCSHNTCTFCEMYKRKKFHLRPLQDVLADIEEVAGLSTRFEKIFICDGDALILPMKNMLAILEALKASFPHARLISCYAGPQSILLKTPEELKTLREAGLGRVYLGVESGSDAVLRHVKKGVDAETMLRAGLQAKAAGMDLWTMVIIGLGGRNGSKEHIQKTVELINKMQPNHLSALNLMTVPGTELYDEVVRGEFQEITAVQSLQETRDLVAGIEAEHIHFTSDHASNYLPLKGTLSQDRDRMLKLLDGALAGTVGVRSEYMRGL